MQRRWWTAAAALAIGACGTSNDPGATPQDSGAALDAGGGADADADATATPAPEDVAVYAVAELPRTEATQGLSGTFFDEATSTLFAIQDLRPRIVPLVAAPGFAAFSPGTPIDLTGRPVATWDGEGLVKRGSELFAITMETEPRLERFDMSGAYLGRVDLPARFANQAPGNKGLESLTLSPRFLFTANEAALTDDGPVASKARGTLVRVVRLDVTAGTTTEHAYRSEPLGAGAGAGDMGVTELLALTDDVLLVLERGFQAGYGNTVRIFRVDLGGAPDVSGVAALGDATPVVAKKLLVDIGALAPGSVTHPSPQPNPLLDNYESLALGPTIADGRRLLFLTTDDNASATQVARVLVLAIRGL
jgi:hypothetical protein